MASIVNLIGNTMTKLHDKIEPYVDNPKTQKRLVLAVVCIALLLDNMLYMVIVPIIPDYLSSIDAWGPPNRTKQFINRTHIETIRNTTVNVTQTGWKWMIVNRAAEDSAVGVLFASKAIIQLFVNPFTGALIDRIGYDLPMMIGLAIIFVSTCMFALGRSYWVLFLARSLQGFGSAFADTGGLAMIANRFTQDAERTTALGIALAFISFGYIVAPPFGGLLYQYAGKQVPFMVLALTALLDGCMMMVIMKPAREERAKQAEQQTLPQPTPIWRLFLDPYIALCSGALVMANTSLAFLEPTIALWMERKLHSTESEIGLVWLPAFLPHVAGVYLTVKLAKMYPKHVWLIAAAGLTLEGVSCLIIPFANVFTVLIVPLCIICFGAALIDTSVLPTLGLLVDLRHSSVYGSIYAIADISYSFAYAVGPMIAGGLIRSIGFTALNVFIFVTNVLYAPLLFFLWRIYKYRPMDRQDIGKEESAGENGALYEDSDGMNYDAIGETPGTLPYQQTPQDSGSGKWKDIQGLANVQEDGVAQPTQMEYNY